MISNVKEATADKSIERKEEDTNCVKDLLKDFSVDGSNIKVFKMGKQAKGKNRLLNVVSSHPEDVQKVLRSIVNLKNRGDCFGRGIQFEIDGVIVIVTDKHDIVKKFNKYFVNIIDEIVDSTDVGPEYVNPYNSVCEFSEFKLLELSDLAKFIDNLENKRGKEVMDIRFIKSTFGVVGNVLLHF
ncbi:hypothetical protein HHI36_009841, partial [Cryptolaemus montrouzieri]